MQNFRANSQRLDNLHDTSSNQMSQLIYKDTSFGSTKSKVRAKSSNSFSRININNEFVSNQLDPQKLEEYIEMLQVFEKNCIVDRKFKDAELAAERIKELKEQEIEYRGVVVTDKHKVEIDDLEKLNLSQFNEFNKMWDELIQEHIENMKKIEQEMLDAHQEELKKHDEEVDAIVIPKPRFSKELLNTKVVLSNLIKTKKYLEAQEISDKIEEMERTETERWNATYKDKFIKKKSILLVKQKNEIDALRVKLENSLQEKLRMRNSELQKLLQRFQNMKKELELRQNQEVAKLKVMGAKNKASNGSVNATRGNISILGGPMVLQDKSNLEELCMKIGDEHERCGDDIKTKREISIFCARRAYKGELSEL